MTASRRINTTTEANTLGDINEDWKVVALLGAGGWAWCGDLADPKQNMLFRNLAYPTRAGEQPHISTVTGRDWSGQLCIYARIFPVKFRRSPSAPKDWQ